jgi:hypothetical protein
MPDSASDATTAHPPSFYGDQHVSQRRSPLWYLAVVVLLLFVIKDPSGAAFLAHAGLDLLSDAATGLAKLVGSK